MLVDRFVEEAAARCPDKTAIIAGERRVTYRQLDERANQVAHALQQRGVRRHDRVAIQLDNAADTAAAIFGVLKTGGVLVVINPMTKPERLARVTTDCGAAAIVTREFFDVSTTTHAATPPPKQHIDLDLAALIYTSGSTGGPKGAMLTHRNIVAATTSIAGYLENTSADVILSVLPLSFGYGLSQLLTMVKVGGTVVFENGFNYPHRLLELIAREQVTGMPIVPTIAAILLQMDLSKYALPSLRYITNAGAALPVTHARQLRQLLPSVRIFAMYGQTECTRISYLPPEQLDVRPTSVGVPIPNEEVSIVDEHGEEVPAGEVGELVVRGSHVMAGYWGRPEETERALRPGRFPGERVLYTGDLFRRDADGYLYFISRKDDIIKTRGQKVAPREVEEVLLSMPAIAEAAVVGVPDPVLTAAVKAVVTLRPGEQVTELEIRRYCAERLEDFMVPKHIDIRAELPRSAHGKIAKAELVQT